MLGCKFSTSSSRNLHFYNNAEEAVKDIPHGAKLLVGGWFNCAIQCVCLLNFFSSLCPLPPLWSVSFLVCLNTRMWVALLYVNEHIQTGLVLN